MKQNRGERRRLEAEKQKFDGMINQLMTLAHQRAAAIGLELDLAFTQGDDVGVALVLNFNRKDPGICEASKTDLLIERLEAVIESQPEIVDGVDGRPPDISPDRLE